TNDPERRKLFRFMIGLIRSKKVAIDKGLGFLLSMLSYNRHLIQHRKNMKNYREIVMKQDQGPWKDMKKTPE
ncbi:MAG TPA: hypothetical protein VLR52_06410, partial [Bacteroidales bacterium]|nr:hypothetical protein [Bacteroidales bacterium]